MEINVNTIIKDNDPLVREKSEPVSLPLSEEDRALLMDMLTYVIESKDEKLAEEKNLRPAVGIAAVQVGVLKQMIAVDCEIGYDENDEPVKATYALVNPRIISSSAKQAYLKYGEGCLSAETEHSGYVPRSLRVKVEGYDLLRDEKIIIRAEGYLAIVLQHEIDHFSGIMFYDRINQMAPDAKIPGAIMIE